MDPTKTFQSRFLMAPDGGASGGATSSGSATQTVTTSNAATAGATAIVAPAGTAASGAASTGSGDVEKKELTQKEIDALISGAKREGAEKVWQKNGFASEKEFDDFVKTAKAEVDSKKSETQKEKERADKAEIDKKTLEDRVSKAEAKAEALALGVPADKADDLVMLAMTEKGETVAERVKTALEKRPWFKEQATAQVPNLGTRVKNQTSASMQAADAELEKVFGKHSGT